MWAAVSHANFAVVGRISVGAVLRARILDGERVLPTTVLLEDFLVFIVCTCMESMRRVSGGYQVDSLSRASLTRPIQIRIWRLLPCFRQHYEHSQIVSVISACVLCVLNISLQASVHILVQ